VVRQNRAMSLTFGGRLDVNDFDKHLILWVKHQPENRSVGGSIPPLGTTSSSASGRYHQNTIKNIGIIRFPAD
jgi:hypothetical protein